LEGNAHLQLAASVCRAHKLASLLASEKMRRRHGLGTGWRVLPRETAPYDEMKKGRLQVAAPGFLRRERRGPENG
jgi:hypothetical protein